MEEEEKELNVVPKSNPFAGRRPGWYTQTMHLDRASSFVERGTEDDFDCLVSAAYTEGCALFEEMELEFIDLRNAGSQEGAACEGEPQRMVELMPSDITFIAWPGCTREECEGQIRSYFPDLKDRTLAGAVEEAMGDYEASWHDARSLPVEFFLHQVYDLDTSADGAIEAFASTWGIPASPLRISQADPRGYYDLLGEMGPDEFSEREFGSIGQLERILRANEAGIAETDLFHNLLIEKRQSAALARKAPEKPEGPVVSISLKEARASLDLVKYTVSWFQGILNFENERTEDIYDMHTSLPWSSFGDSRFLLELINSIHDNVPLVVQCGWESPRDAHASDLDVSGRAYDQCDFIRIVMRQLADTLANDEVEWKQCRNCGRFFKYKQPKRLTIRSSHRDAMYCSHKCADNKAHKEKQRRDTAAASRSGNRKKRKRKTRT